MDSILSDITKLERKSNLGPTIKELDSILSALQTARSSLASATVTPDTSGIQLQHLLTADKVVRERNAKIAETQKAVYSGIGKLGKSLDKRFKGLPSLGDGEVLPVPPSTETDAKDGKDGAGEEGKNGLNGALRMGIDEDGDLYTCDDDKPKDTPPRADDPALITRAIAMHLIRLGEFSTAEILLSETATKNLHLSLPPHLREDFERMYAIREQIQNDDFEGAIQWCREEANARELGKRGSRLEWELVRMRFLRVLEGGGIEKAVEYAKGSFGRFREGYMHEIEQLMSSLLYRSSPYSPYPSTPTSSSDLTPLLSTFTKEYCTLLTLSSLPPLLLATQAGTLSLPTLLKISALMRQKKTAWTSTGELPVEIPLPSQMTFHNIFVCPVSKEQCREEEGNYPVLLGCGHVIAFESLRRLPRVGTTGHAGQAQGAAVKCPYCPRECREGEWKRVVL